MQQLYDQFQQIADEQRVYGLMRMMKSKRSSIDENVVLRFEDVIRQAREVLSEMREASGLCRTCVEVVVCVICEEKHEWASSRCLSHRILRESDGST